MRHFQNALLRWGHDESSRAQKHETLESKTAVLVLHRLSVIDLSPFLLSLATLAKQAFHLWRVRMGGRKN